MSTDKPPKVRRMKVGTQRFATRAATHTRFGHDYRYPELSLCGAWMEEAGIKCGTEGKPHYVVVVPLPRKRLLVRSATTAETKRPMRKIKVLGRLSKRDGKPYVYPRVRISPLYLAHLKSQPEDYVLVRIKPLEGLTIEPDRNES